MESMCIICHDQPAAFRCIQCHKPVCDGCAFKDEHGAFCSRECAANYRAFYQAQARKSARRTGLIKTLIVLIVLGMLAAVVAWKAGLLPRSVEDKLREGAEKVIPAGETKNP